VGGSFRAALWPKTETSKHAAREICKAGSALCGRSSATNSLSGRLIIPRTLTASRDSVFIYLAELACRTGRGEAGARGYGRDFSKVSTAISLGHLVRREAKGASERAAGRLRELPVFRNAVTFLMRESGRRVLLNRKISSLESAR